VRRVALLLTLVPAALAGSAAGVRAQGGMGPPGHSCDGCHLTHLESAMGSVDRTALLGELDVRPGTPRGERACLACHHSADERLRVGVYLAPDEPLPMHGGFIGEPTLVAHPIGRPALLSDPRSGTFDPRAGANLWSARPADADPDLTVTCSSCHDPHAAWGEDPAVAGESTVCHRCHTASAYLTPDHVSVPCAGCHAIHDPRGIEGPGPAGDAACAECHLTLRRGSLPVGILGDVPPGHVDDRPGRCTDCHPAHSGWR
jgi:predicted CXXCH cytochrome family protein